MTVRRLQDLAALKTALAEQQREAQARAAREREAAAQVERERSLFARSVGPVQPLRDRGLAKIDRPRPAPLPRQRERDERAALREAWSDEVDVERLLDTDGELSFRRPHIAPDVLAKLRRGRWAIQAQIDLHGLRRDEAREALAAFLRDATQRGLRCVRVVHGKGHGSPGKAPVLKGKVRAWLVQKDAVLAFVQARAADGGHGALVVLLAGAAAAPQRAD
ncbi:Smr/MutS family protein [Calidifontimicrobium sp. SYSU G02091]|uniref:Smr/MutS family protein n=1 Tax=Calidifontimicrobium sp. SYSU G02091 TaxID=2926421 RepID=UPI001F53C39C|nr:Smr/MutS family protein [Calidifontimicrobium sp. SYSU G02091]MCI1191146.1 Smr/MutS family protein [Calidifontimicrobium sp. SYSU G02091]